VRYAEVMEVDADVFGAEEEQTCTSSFLKRSNKVHQLVQYPEYCTTDGLDSAQKMTLF